MIFGQRLQKKRQSLHLTQVEVAQQLHVSQQTISSWEQGKSYPDIDSLIKLSDFYQISLDVLLKEDIGVKESIKKNEVFHFLKPLLYSMLLLNLFLLVILILHLYQHEYPMTIYLILTIVLIVNSVSLIYLAAFIKGKIRKKENSIHKKQLLLVIACWGVLVVMFLFLKSYLYAGISTGIALGVILVEYLQQRYF
ncbi:MAG: helix-turn-helix domain-containing protein [Lactobacillus sp.]|uniref:helix-turn-helix domain-containing protein n=1 Tax=Bombilactobacillus bombi TaxID=1303590 RepID=UPI0035E9701D|nr:helix-turn-helix domain-containing protein [Lactobacillus sp.]